MGILLRPERVVLGCGMGEVVAALGKRAVGVDILPSRRDAISAFRASYSQTMKFLERRGDVTRYSGGWRATRAERVRTDQEMLAEVLSPCRTDNGFAERLIYGTDAATYLAALPDRSVSEIHDGLCLGNLVNAGEIQTARNIIRQVVRVLTEDGRLVSTSPNLSTSGLQQLFDEAHLRVTPATHKAESSAYMQLYAYEAQLAGWQQPAYRQVNGMTMQ